MGRGRENRKKMKPGKIFDAVELMRQLRTQVHGEAGRLGRAKLKEYLRARVNMPRPAAKGNS
uniref:Uncharacterized protein n=1 Tax=Candidatus Kentrum sp. FM TaxID=2126340 RepID=A0A450S6S8_9GAMM|nr:MAG: hypothetical protein BECKFM1743A_GA0114220_100491 [Candidatus Kentron sp. FM]VFJ52441.1 MAG: hypothetical protein BECKFM1743C_GA0114222_1010815 [Candidatus Kentron sp. FM]VFK07702.1 MAG: hypothetical protein BECKFM1743B_GA0114221_100491 [Candidatus Kentron sp. FM]